MAQDHRTIKVARDEDLRSQIGSGGFYFDLVDFDRVRAFQVPVDTTVILFMEELAKELGTPVKFQRLWLCQRRQNGTRRPSRPLNSKEKKLSIGRVFSADVKLFLEVLNPCSPRNLNREYLLVFLKFYDPEQTQLRYIGTLFVSCSSRPLDILPKLRSLAGFCADEEIELYEEIKFEPNVMCEALDIHHTFTVNQIENGDIICFQKRPKSCNQHLYPSVKLFLEHVHKLTVAFLLFYFQDSNCGFLLAAGLHFQLTLNLVFQPAPTFLRLQAFVLLLLFESCCAFYVFFFSIQSCWIVLYW
uniref:Ubiquitin carboxyl-terminal hydrolase 7 ICP0-binding domain-containing protein n=1 Tax=Triticum urartu TaxID=4572 RepID=A0A8R7Q338_TRIUA